MALGLALGGQPQLQLFDGLHQLLLGLDPGRLIAAAAGGRGEVLLRAVGQQAVRQGAARGRQALGVGAREREKRLNQSTTGCKICLCSFSSSYLLLLSVVSSIRPESLPLHELRELRVDSRP